MKISLRFFTRSFRHFSADANLPVQFDPVKRQCRVRIGLELLSFFAFVIRKKNEAVLIEAFQQNNADRRSAIPAGSGQAHCVDVANTRFDCGGEPVAELLDWIGIKIAPAQTFPGVLVARSGRISWNLHEHKKSGQDIAARKLSTHSSRSGGLSPPFKT